MTDNLAVVIESYQRELLQPAAMLFAVQQVYGDKVREQTMKAYGHLIDAHMLITGVLAAALFRVNGKITPITATSGQRDALFASFIIGMDPCERTIAEGRYLQAGALLRQEVELLAQLKAVRAGTKNETRSPNIAVLEESIRRLYGRLSSAAHVSKHHIVWDATKWDVSGDDLPGPTSGTRFFPDFNKEWARSCFSLHLALILGLIEELNIDLHELHKDDEFTAREVEALNLALKLMQDEGMVELDD